MTVGAELVQARQKLGFPLDEISSRTKIRVERLSAIEQMDGPALPSFVYLKGFLKAYATEVQLDPEDIAQRYLAEADVVPPATAPTASERELVASTIAAHDSDSDITSAVEKGIAAELSDPEGTFDPRHAITADELALEPMAPAMPVAPTTQSAAADAEDGTVQGAFVGDAAKAKARGTSSAKRPKPSRR